MSTAAPGSPGSPRPAPRRHPAGGRAGRQAARSRHARLRAGRPRRGKRGLRRPLPSRGRRGPCDRHRDSHGPAPHRRGDRQRDPLPRARLRRHALRLGRTRHRRGLTGRACRGPGPGRHRSPVARRARRRQRGRIRLGAAAGTAFHARGFHPTAVCGVFGAAAAAARMRELDAARPRARSESRAASPPASWSSSPMGRPRSGCIPAGQRTPGFTPRAWPRTARAARRPSSRACSGSTRTHLGRRDVPIEAQLADLGERWETPNIAFKPYPGVPLPPCLGRRKRRGDGRPPGRVRATSRRSWPRCRKRRGARPRAAGRQARAARLPMRRSSASSTRSPRCSSTARSTSPPTPTTPSGDPEVLELARLVDYEVRDFPTARPGVPRRGASGCAAARS